MTTRDPLWRRFFSDLGIRILCWSELIRWDWLRWKVDAAGSRLFSWAYNGSLEERDSALRGDVPWRYLASDLRKSLRDEFDDDTSLEMLEQAVDSAFDEILDIVDLDHPGFDVLDVPARLLVERSCETAMAALHTALQVIRSRRAQASPLLLKDKEAA